MPNAQPAPLSGATSPRTSTTAHGSSSSSRMSGASSTSGAALDAAGTTASTSHDDSAAVSRPPPHHSVQSAASSFICNPLRQMVSQNRRRFQEDGFNLDLTYITDRIIAMGYPADTKEAIYRNSMAATVQFLEYHHAGHYKVFNLRGQYVYDTSKFHNRVLSFEMADHHPPRLEMMAPFCREVHEYLKQDPANVVAVHCKAGKGRTGVMICAYLVYINFYPLPRQNMDYYSIIRTNNNKGVTIPSQRRYVYYFSHLRQAGLNYMPLRVELTGIFLEKPPRPASTFPSFLKKGLAIRVVNGDVDVFLGDVIHLSREEWDKEEAAWGEGVVGRGEDAIETGGDCLSRRAYGWQVPPDRRVFLEGDVRIEIHVRNVGIVPMKEKKKIGHAWMNTMFTCSAFCGGAYMHGDEAYPYPPGATTIACRRPQIRPKSGSASLPSSPPSTPKSRAGGGSMSGRRAPSFDARKASRAPPKLSQINHVVRKFTGNSSEPTNEAGRRTKRQRTKGTASSADATDSDDELELLRPPGLDEHCPESSLRLIYGTTGRKPPREGINVMLRDAHKKNLISDVYNERRLSVPQEGMPVERAPEGRPSAGGPHCIRRAPDEHVNVFSVLEIDEAYKNKDIDPGFKMIVLTRCVPDSAADERLSDKFLDITHEKQGLKDLRKKAKVEARLRKLASANSSAGAARDETADTVCSAANEGSDPRLSDPFLKKFFYRQRTDSLSRYPTPRHACPLQCSSAPSTSSAVPPAMSASVVSTSSSVVGREEEGREAADRMASISSRSTTVGPSTSAGVPSESARVALGDVSICDAIESSLSDLDVEVRNYHPDDTNWLHSQSSASSSSVSSESDPNASTGALAVEIGRAHHHHHHLPPPTRSLLNGVSIAFSQPEVPPGASSAPPPPSSVDSPPPSPPQLPSPPTPSQSPPAPIPS